MTARTSVLPAPTWHGTPANLQHQWFEFLRGHARQQAQTRPAQLRRELSYAQSDNRDDRAQLRSYANESRNHQEKLTRLRASVRTYNDEDYLNALEALFALPEVIATRVDRHGALVVLIRPIRSDSLDLGDFEISFDDLVADYNSYIVRSRLTQDDVRYRNLSMCDSFGNNTHLFRVDSLTRQQFCDFYANLDLAGLVRAISEQINEVTASSRALLQQTVPGAEPLWDGFVENPLKALKQLQKRALDRHQLARQIREQERLVADYDRAMRDLRERIRQNEADIRRMEAELVALEATARRRGEIIDLADARRTLRFITHMPGFLGMRFDEDGTAVIHIRTSWVYRDRRYDLGDFELWLRPNRGNHKGYGVVPIHATRLPSGGRSTTYFNRYASHRPGLNENDWFCFGGRSGELGNMLNDGDFGHFVNIAVNCMNSVNNADKPGHAHHLPVIPMEEVWRHQPRTRARRWLARVAIASQLLYKPRDLYRPKVEVCQEYIQTYGDCQVVVEVHQRLFTAEDRITTPVVISAVDNQDARRMIWQAVQDSPDVRLLIDGRIGSEAFTCLAVDMLDDSDWYDTKFLGDNIAQLPCASRAIAYPAVALGAVITRHLVHWHAGEELPRRVSQDMRDLVQLVIQAPK